MKPAEVERFLRPTLPHVGFKIDEIQDVEIYGNRAACASYYRGEDCKLQICWSARDDGIDFMLAPLDATNSAWSTDRRNGSSCCCSVTHMMAELLLDWMPTTLKCCPGSRRSSKHILCPPMIHYGRGMHGSNTEASGRK